jgi:disulfide bond formation protein DsbB
VLRKNGLYLAWLVALTATLGSLYFSEVRLYVPCTLCWYQRILMYPLVILLGIASYRQDSSIVRYTLPFSALGMGIASYHYLEQKVPGFGLPSLCRSGVPCTTSYIDWLGFITIPFLSLTAFILITIMLVAVISSRAPEARTA